MMLRIAVLLLLSSLSAGCGGGARAGAGAGGGTQTMADVLRWKASHVSTPNQPVWFTDQQFITQFGQPKISKTGKFLAVGVGELFSWEVEASDGTTQFLVSTVTKDALAKQVSGMSRVNAQYWEGRMGHCTLLEAQ